MPKRNKSGMKGVVRELRCFDERDFSRISDGRVIVCMDIITDSHC